MKRKFKYWTGTFNEQGQRLTLGMPFERLSDARGTLHQFNSDLAAVVRADKNEKPTTQVVWRIDPKK